MCFNIYMKRVKIFFGLLGITFFASVLFFYYRTDVFLESSYLQGNIWWASEQENNEQNIAAFTNSCAGLHVELVSLGGQVNETRKKLDEFMVRATSLGETIDTLKKKQSNTLTIINKIKEEKLAKESQTRKTQYTLNTIERLVQEQKTQENIWSVWDDELQKQEAELWTIQITLGELREEISTFEKKIHSVEKDITKCTTEK